MVAEPPACGWHASLIFPFAIGRLHQIADRCLQLLESGVNQNSTSSQPANGPLNGGY